MLCGHNSNVKAGDTTYHVQTEDRGAANALIDTTVYFRGRVLHRRTNNYFDLLPLNPASEQALKQRLDEQHRAVVEAIRTGALHLALPQDEKVSAPAAATDSALARIDQRQDLALRQTRLAAGRRSKPHQPGYRRR
jgi:hypothetical protein